MSSETPQPRRGGKGKAKGKEKLRAEFRKNRGARSRQDDRELSRNFRDSNLDEDQLKAAERISGKGALVQKRTIVGTQHGAGSESTVQLNVDAECLTGRVTRIHGLLSHVQTEDGREFRCATRRLLKTLQTDQRHVVATGDMVMIRVVSSDEGMIERVEPRHGVLARTSRGKQHVLVTNVDQMLIIASAAEPDIKPHLIDRMIISAERAGIKPIVCINKIDLVDPASLQPLAGVYGQMGYAVLLLSATTRVGIEQLRRCTMGKQSAVAGQSGVGKSSLLNAMQEGLDLRVREVSAENEKGRHTTTSATLIRLDDGGWIVDTPGIRQFQLWDVIPEEVAGFCRDLRPFVSHCRFPNCTHTHEESCAVKDAVADGLLDLRRYESYRHMFAGDMV